MRRTSFLSYLTSDTVSAKHSCHEFGTLKLETDHSILAGLLHTSGMKPQKKLSENPGSQFGPVAKPRLSPRPTIFALVLIQSSILVVLSLVLSLTILLPKTGSHPLHGIQTLKI